MYKRERLLPRIVVVHDLLKIYYKISPVHSLSRMSSGGEEAVRVAVQEFIKVPNTQACDHIQNWMCESISIWVQFARCFGILSEANHIFNYAFHVYGIEFDSCHFDFDVDIHAHLARLFRILFTHLRHADLILRTLYFTSTNSKQNKKTTSILFIRASYQARSFFAFFSSFWSRFSC